MKKINRIFIQSICIFLIASIAHFVYSIFPYDFIGVFFPVNESLFEHLKMIYTSFFIFYFLLFVLKKPLGYQNIFFSMLINSITTIILFDIIYIPIYYRYGENLLLTFIILFVSIFVTQYLYFFILLKKDYKKLEILSIIIISLIFIILGYLTFEPLPYDFFYDPISEGYGIRSEPF